MRSPQRYCPKCGSALATTHTRATNEDSMTYRRKRCTGVNCDIKISTIEYTTSINDESLIEASD